MMPSMNIRVNIFEKAYLNPLRELFWKKLFCLSTNKKGKFEPLGSKIHLLVFALYEMAVAGQCGNTLF